MKLNYLSRLTALLLALMMLPLAAFAEGTSIDDLTGDTLETYDSVTAFLEAMEAANKCSLCAETLGNRGLLSWPVDGYDCLHTYLGSMTSNEAYQLLYDLDFGTTEEYTLSQVYINAHNAHVDDTTEELHRDAVICYGFDCYTNPLAVPGPSHVEGSCPWWQETEYVYVPLAQNTLTSGVVTVSGKMPVDVALVVTEATVDTSIMDLSYFDADSYTTFGYNIALYRPGADATIGTEDDVKWQPKDNGETVTVTIAKAYSVEDYPAVDVYHVKDDGTMELLTSRNGSVELTEDGSSFSFTVEEFSEFTCAAGTWTLMLGSGDNVESPVNITVQAGVETVLHFIVQSTNNVTITPNTASDGFIAPTVEEITYKSANGQSVSTQTGTMLTVGTTRAVENITTDPEQSYTITWGSNWNARTYVINFLVVNNVTIATGTNAVNHIQINLTFDAVITDDYGNTLNATVTLPNPSNYTPTTTGGNTTSFTTTATNKDITATFDSVSYTQASDTSVKVELIDPDGYNYTNDPKFSVTGITTQSGQLSLDGSFPVGVFGAPVMYRVTVDTTILVPVYETNEDGTYKIVDGKYVIKTDADGNVITKSQKVSLSKIIHYWHPDNICPGASNHYTAGSPEGKAGIDIGDFGASMQGTGTLNLTKTFVRPEDYTAAKTFRIYVEKQTLTTNEDGTITETWTRIDSYTKDVTVAATQEKATAVITDIPYGTYRIVEDVAINSDAAYNAHIDGYTLSTEYTTTETVGETTTTVATNMYTFSKDARSWNANVKNTYTAKAGDLKITKNVVNNTIYANDENLADDAFEFTVTLKDASDVPLTGSVTYTIGTTPTTVTLTSEGKFTLSLKKDETATIAKLPDGTKYTVTETDIPAGYTVDVEEQQGTIQKDSISAVVFTNTYKVGSLTIKKIGMTEGSAVVDVNLGGKVVTVVLNSKNNWTSKINNIKLETTCSISEDGWSWRYTMDSTTLSEVPDKITGDHTVTITNTKDTDKWLDGETSVENIFGDASDSNSTVTKN